MAFFYPHGHNWGQMWGQSVRWVQVQKVSYPLASYLWCKGKILPLGKQLRAHRDKGCPLQSGASSLWWGRLGWWLTCWGLPGWGKRLRSPSLQSQVIQTPPWICFCLSGAVTLRARMSAACLVATGGGGRKAGGVAPFDFWRHFFLAPGAKLWESLYSFYKTALAVLIHLPFHLSSFKDKCTNVYIFSLTPVEIL